MAEMRIHKPEGIITLPIKKRSSLESMTPLIHTALLKANSFGSLSANQEEPKLQIEKSQPSNDDENIKNTSPYKLEPMGDSGAEYK